MTNSDFPLADEALPDDYDLPSSEDMLALALWGGAFDWLKDEPDIYTLDDGEPITWSDDEPAASERQINNSGA